ncbi:MAG: histidine phosphatase family protein [Oscillatoria sp. SIO1A7]|nr:histidine phosphatase family protein [Oscillatoria sp. SIO1A7]
MPQTVWIARHANRLDFVRPEWFNTAELRYDPPLSDDGLVQAKLLAKRLEKEEIAHIFASPFLRTVQTANEVAEVLDLPVKLESGLSEFLNPEWFPAMPERLPFNTLAKQFPRIDRNYVPAIVPEYPETEGECLGRAGETARRLAAEFPQDILLVGHRASVTGMAMGLVAGLAETDIHAALCCLVKVRHDGEQWTMELGGDTSHLNDSEAVLRFN